MSKKNQRKKHADFFKEAAKVMSSKSIERAAAKARDLLMNFELAELRESSGIKQTGVAGFSQPSVSKIENAKDMKLSTLVEYLKAMNYGIEINAVPLSGSSRKKTLLKVS
jgi:hypothetical protein